MPRSLCIEAEERGARGNELPCRALFCSCIAMPSRERSRLPGGMVRLQFALAFVATYLVHINMVTVRDLAHLVPRDEDTTATAGSRIRRTTSPSLWTESHSPYHTMDPEVRISFRLHDPKDVPRPDKFLSVKPYTCGMDKAELPASLSLKTVLGFTATLATDLKVVHLGDSLGQQFVQGFDAAVLGEGYESNRAVLQEYFYEGKIYSHNCLSVAAPIRGGGISSYWRVTDLISRNNHRKEAVCAKEELQLKQRIGWSTEQSLELVGHKYLANETDSNRHHVQSGTSFPVGPLDAVVMRIPHGWMDIPDITHDRLVEAITLAHENLGVQTVILTTLPLNNNVLNASDWWGIHQINGMIRHVAHSWNSLSGKGVQWVLVQEFGDFTSQILWESAHHLGYHIPAPDFTKRQSDGWDLSGSDFLLDRLPLAKRKWPPSISMVCAERPSPGGKDCTRNKISTDGMHWCIETLGPRYSASIACLLGCVYNGSGGRKAVPERSDGDVRKCERECNERFMSLAPVGKEWIGGETTLFSRASGGLLHGGGER